jgi:hypothetical protein
MKPAMIHYFPGGGGKRITTPGFMNGADGYILSGSVLRELVNPWYSVFPPTKSTDADISFYRGTLSRTMESVIRAGYASARDFAD